jgi:hypothetical protein
MGGRRMRVLRSLRGEHNRDDLGSGERRRVALVELVAQHVAVQADGPCQLLLGAPSCPQPFPQCRTERNQVSRAPLTFRPVCPASKLMR